MVKCCSSSELCTPHSVKKKKHQLRKPLVYYLFSVTLSSVQPPHTFPFPRIVLIIVLLQIFFDKNLIKDKKFTFKWCLQKRIAYSYLYQGVWICVVLMGFDSSGGKGDYRTFKFFNQVGWLVKYMASSRLLNQNVFGVGGRQRARN